MELKLHYEPVSKQDIVQYSKDTLTLMRQNISITFMLVFLGMFSSFIVGLLILGPEMAFYYFSVEGQRSAVVFAIYSTISDAVWVLLTIAPFWIIFFFTGFRMMEKNTPSLPFFQVIKWNVGIIRSLWSVGFFLSIIAILFVINFIFLEDPESNQAYDKLKTELGYHASLALSFFSVASKGLAFGLGIYWFSFIPLLIYQGLLYGNHVIPRISQAAMMVVRSEETPWRRLSVFVIFMIIDLLVSVVLSVIYLMFKNIESIIAVIFLRGLAYVFIAGVLYNYCVDKIEGRKVEKKVKESVLSGKEVPNPV